MSTDHSTVTKELAFIATLRQKSEVISDPGPILHLWEIGQVQEADGGGWPGNSLERRTPWPSANSKWTALETWRSLTAYRG